MVLFKCMIVYLERDIPAFVMYCVYGASRSFLLIESTDSMIELHLVRLQYLQKSVNGEEFA